MDKEKLFEEQVTFLKKLNHVEILDIDFQRKTVALNIRGGEYIATSRNDDLNGVLIVLSWIDNFNLEEVNYAYFRKLLTYVQNVDTLFYQRQLMEAVNLSRNALDIFIEACEYTEAYKIINVELFQKLHAELEVNSNAS